MSPERAARRLARLGALLWLILFALRGFSLAQTLTTSAPEPVREALPFTVRLDNYLFSEDGEQVSFEVNAPNQVASSYTLDLSSGVVTTGRLEIVRTGPFRIMDGQIFLRISEEWSPLESAPRGVEFQEIVLSPSGGAAAITGQRPGGPDDLYVLNTSGRMDWLGEEEWIIAVDWSPDGQYLTYLAPRGGFNQIIRVRPDGTGLRQLTSDPTHKTDPVWSPDSANIAYLAVEVPINPEPLERITPTGPGSDPTATPTVTPIAGTPSPTPTPQTTEGEPVPETSTYLRADVFVTGADGTNTRRLTDTPAREDNLTWINNGSELAFTVFEPEVANADFLYALNPQTGAVRRAFPQLSLDAIECPPAIPRSEERTLRLTLTNQGVQPVGVPVILRAGGQPFSIESIYEQDQRRVGAVRVETVDVGAGETKVVEWPVRPVPGTVTHFSALIDRPEAVLFAEQQCASQNTYYGLPSLPFLPFTLPLLIPGLLLAVPWLLQQKKPVLWLLWALIPVLLASLILFEAQRVSIDRIFMPF